MTDPIDFGKEIGGLIREAIAPVKRELEELRERAPEKGDPAWTPSPWTSMRWPTWSWRSCWSRRAC